jgi:hypothetical protein
MAGPTSTHGSCVSSRLLPSQIVPFKKVVTQILDNFDSRAYSLTDQEMTLAARVILLDDILEEMFPREKLVQMLQTKEVRHASRQTGAGHDSLAVRSPDAMIDSSKLLCMRSAIAGLMCVGACRVRWAWRVWRPWVGRRGSR